MATDLETSPIPDTPPAGSTKRPNAAMVGIAAIKAACDAGGLTSKYAKCALLGIIGVESIWEPVEENHSFSQTQLKSIFSNVSAEDAAKYARWKGPKQEFFGWLYGTRLKKTTVEGNYYGRGYIQLTFRDNYKKFSTSEYNLVSNPELLLQSDIAAKVAVAFIKANVRNWQEEMHKPGFVYKCQSAVNPRETSGGNYNTKIKYYEYFYGGKAAPVPNDKDASNTAVNKSAKEIADAPQNKKEAYREDRTTNETLGFCDPNGQYPLRDYMNEPDTNRLARGIIDGTHIKFKDSTRETGIPIANGVDGGSYDQPFSAYNTVYPYNKVFESEAGHVLEFDDSAGGERVNLYHRKGTFIEIDPNGTQVNFIVGDGFYITERNGNVFVNGTCNITTGSDCNILCQGNANVEVKGTSDVVLHNDTNIGVATDLNLVVGGNFNLKVDNNFNIQVGNSLSLQTKQVVSVDAGNSLLLSSKKNVSVQSAELLSFKGKRINLNDPGYQVINTELDENSGLYNNSVLDEAPKSEEPIRSKLASLIAPPVEVSSKLFSPNLQPPERHFAVNAKFESDEEWDTPEGSKAANKQFTGTEYQNSSTGSPSDTSDATGGKGSGVSINPDLQNDIMNRGNFSNNYKLSTHFTLGMIVPPGIILRDTTLPAGKSEPGKTGSRLYTKQELVANMAALSVNILEPIYELMGPHAGKFATMDPAGKWCINDGLRNNTNGSDHNKGRAIDIRLNPRATREEMFNWAKQLEAMLPYNQFILEYRKPGAKGNSGVGAAWQNWIHISYSTEGNQKMCFTMVDDVKTNSGLVLYG